MESVDLKLKKRSLSCLLPSLAPALLPVISSGPKERNSKKGEFSRAKLAGKRVIELGAGCGLAGLGKLRPLEVFAVFMGHVHLDRILMEEHFKAKSWNA